MSRILLADDSPHAQRMGEWILREEGYEVVSVTDGNTALIRLEDADPDVVLADVLLPGRSGYELCQHVKTNPRHRHVRVVLTAGLLEPIDEAEASRVQSDGILKKPFEASAVIGAVKPLVEASQLARGVLAEVEAPPEPDPDSEPAIEVEAAVDPERVRAAVTLALEAALPTMIDEITGRVLVALNHAR